MSSPVAKENDEVVGVDLHIVLVTVGGVQVPLMLPSTFRGPLSRDLASSVFVDNKAVALVGSGADNTPSHIPSGGQFQREPANEGTVAEGSDSVFANSRAVARSGDPVECCNDPSNRNSGNVIAGGSVFSG